MMTVEINLEELVRSHSCSDSTIQKNMWLTQVAVLHLIVQYCWTVSSVKQLIFSFLWERRLSFRVFNALRLCNSVWFKKGLDHRGVTGLHFTLQARGTSRTHCWATITLKCLHALGKMQGSTPRCSAVFVLACLDMLVLASATTLNTLPWQDGIVLRLGVCMHA